MQKKSSELNFLNFFSFLLGFQAILAAYVMSPLLQEATGIENVGGFFFLAYFFSFILILNLHHFVKKIGKGRVFFVAALIKLVALLGIGFFSKSFLVVGFAFFSLLIGPIMWVGLDLLVETFSQDKITGAIRGRLLTIMNTGCFLAPFLAAFLIEKSGQLATPFLFAAGLVFIVVVLSALKFFNLKNDYQKDLPIRKVLKKIAKRKNIQRIYLVSFMLEFFYAVMIIHTASFFIQQGLNWSEIGRILTIMLIPFIIIQYPLGVAADKKWGEKEGILIGLFIMAITSILMIFPTGNKFFYWTAVLFVSRIGASMVELLRDSYFYKKIAPTDVDVIDFFRTTRSIAYIITGSLSFLLLLFFSIEKVFLVLGVVILIGMLPVFKLKDTL